ncbi:Pho80p cyclin [Rhodosporidiobolus nylandii]
MASLSAPSSDPTNANAIAGPSRANVPAAPTANGAARAMPTAAPPAPAPTPAPPAARTQAPPPKRSANGPLIVKTLVSSVDGVREVPSAFEHCEVDDLIVLISSMLDRLIQHNDRIPLSPDSLTRFHSRAPPNISVRDYLVRIARFTNVEPCCLLMLLPYVDKVCARLPTFTISSLTVHRFIIAAISVGSKALSDAFCTNGRYSRVGGVSIVEMNLLEKEFCEALDWRLTTSGPVLAHYYTSLVTSHPQYRVSSAPLPTPPPPPPVDVPPPFPPPPRGERAPLAPVAFAAGGGGGATGAGPMDVDPPAPASQPPASVAPQAHNPSASLNSSLSASIASSASASSFAPPVASPTGVRGSAPFGRGERGSRKRSGGRRGASEPGEARAAFAVVVFTFVDGGRSDGIGGPSR